MSKPGNPTVEAKYVGTVMKKVGENHKSWCSYFEICFLLSVSHFWFSFISSRKKKTLKREVGWISEKLSETKESLEAVHDKEERNILVIKKVKTVCK